jgi:hypothetical protein
MYSCLRLRAITGLLRPNRRFGALPDIQPIG